MNTRARKLAKIISDARDPTALYLSNEALTILGHREEAQLRPKYRSWVSALAAIISAVTGKHRKKPTKSSLQLEPAQEEALESWKGQRQDQLSEVRFAESTNDEVEAWLAWAWHLRDVVAKEPDVETAINYIVSGPFFLSDADEVQAVRPMLNTVVASSWLDLGAAFLHESPH